MAETDIINPSPTHPLNFDYGFQRKRPVTHVSVKANQGAAYFRELTDVGHQFVLNWAERETKHARRLKHYYEQYRDGFFTLIDHEGGGRHYVGRFTTPVEPIPISNNKWTVQYVAFEEVPGATMLKYPDRWDLENGDAIWRYLQSDFGQLQVASSGAWAVGASAVAKSGWWLVDPGLTANDWAGMAYVGYGFEFWAPTGPNLGIATIYLDLLNVATIDMYTPTVQESSKLLRIQDVPLGTHLVQIRPTHTKNASSSDYVVLFDALRVMR